jgi:hypothetical protein
MAFLDNSGDIILDAVLTDLGRKRLAEGNYQITKFAIGDDEIDYGLYNLNHSSGSAYYDLEILQTPVFEAFTNNTSVLKSNLMTLNRDVLYLPILKINENDRKGESNPFMDPARFLLMYDKTTIEAVIAGNTNYVPNGNFLDGGNPGNSKHYISVDQGLDSSDLSPASRGLMAGLVENRYLIDIDRRLGKICFFQGHVVDTVGSGDDDFTAQYVITEQAPGNTFVKNTSVKTVAKDPHEVIKGPRGSRVRFKIAVSEQLNGNDTLYDKLGKTATATDLTNMFGAAFDDAGQPGASGTWKYIDTTVKVKGNVTGYYIDIPVRFLKKTA